WAVINIRLRQGVVGGLVRHRRRVRADRLGKQLELADLQVLYESSLCEPWHARSVGLHKLQRLRRQAADLFLDRGHAIPNLGDIAVLAHEDIRFNLMLALLLVVLVGTLKGPLRDRLPDGVEPREFASES